MSSAAFVDLNWKNMVTLNTDQDSLILCSFSNSTDPSAE